MELLFQRTPAGEPPSPRPGELSLVSAAPETQGGLALRVFDHGLAGFPRGTGTVERIVLGADPSFDDLLAAAFAVRLLSGRKLPAGCRAFARYAEEGRRGNKPTDFPFEESLEGMYLGCRLLAGDDLTDPVVGRSFVAHWSRLADHIFRAAANDVDPFATSLFADETPELAPVREWLAGDRDAYRDDVARGERWLLGRRGAGLFLRQPKSRLFRHWARSDRDTPTGRPPEFLAVAGREGRWLFWADAGLNLSFASLAEKVGCAAPQSGKGSGCVVMAPAAGRADDEVLATVQAWLGAVPRRRPRTALAFGALAAVLACAAVVLFAWYRPGLGPVQGGSVPDPDPTGCGSGEEGDRGFVPDPDTTSPQPGAGSSNLYVVAIGVSMYHDPRLNLHWACADAKDLAKAFAAQQGKLFKRVYPTVLTNEYATRQSIEDKLSGLSEKAKPEDFLIVTVSGHGANFGDNDQFYFLPNDFNEQSVVSTAVFWTEFHRCLSGASCRVLVVMDTCHAGTTIQEAGGDGQPGWQQTLKKQGAKGGGGMILMAACLSGDTAKEGPGWRHGALSLALLEALTHRRLYTDTAKTALPDGDAQGTITIQDLHDYACNRVRELTDDRQKVTMEPDVNSLDKVPVARLEKHAQ